MVCFVVVVYNQKIDIQKYVHLERTVFFCDNSTDFTIKSANEAVISSNTQCGFLYFDMKGNHGLSKAYNSIAKKIPEENDFVVLLDQDTDIPPDIVLKYEKYLKSNEMIDILCPIVYVPKGILSPCVVSGTKFKGFNNIENVLEKKISQYSFINSGMCIRRSVFAESVYDENLFLDMVDHDFVMYAKKRGLKIAICFDVILRQTFSGAGKNSFIQDFSRFCIYVNDAKYYYKKWYAKNYKIILFPRAVKLCWLHKKTIFLFKLLTN